MLYLYFDESGDLGFDFFAKKPSKYFTVTVMTVSGAANNRQLINAVKKTIKRKLPMNPQAEMKGSKNSMAIKEYFYRQVSAIPFDIYSVTLDKRSVYDSLAKQKDKVYNFIAQNVLEKIPVENASTRIQVIIDKSKSKKEIVEFNNYIIRHIRGRVAPYIPIDIYHWISRENPGLQAADLFCWGIFRKYEKEDYKWFNMFKVNIRYDMVYPLEE